MSSRIFKKALPLQLSMYLKRAIRGTVSVFIFTALAAVLSYAFRILLARSMDISTYGLFYAMMSFFGFFNLFVELGFLQSISKRVVEWRISKEFSKIKGLLASSFLIQMLISLLLVAVLAFFSDKVVSGFFHSSQTSLFLFMCAWFLLLPVPSFLVHVFLGFQKSGLSASTEFFRHASAVTLTLFFFYTGFGVAAPFMAYALINVLMMLFYAPIVKRVFPEFSRAPAKTSASDLKQVLVFGFYVTFTGLIFSVITQTDTLMITYLLGLESVGLYQLALPVAALIGYVTNSIVPVLFPLITELNARKKSAELKSGITLLYKYLLVVTVPLVFVLFSFSDIIITILFGGEYVSVSPVLKVLSIAMLFSVITTINGFILSSLGKPEQIAKYMIYAAILNLCLNAALIPMIGIMGAAIATLSTFFLATLLSIYKIRSEVGFRFSIKNWMIIILSGGVAALVIDGLRRVIDLHVFIEAPIVIAIAAVAYLAILFGTRILDFSELRDLLKTTLGR